MRYIVDIKEINVNSIKKFIDNGRYKNIVDFINVAIENQIYIESAEIKDINGSITNYKAPAENNSTLNNSLSMTDIRYNNISTVNMPSINQTILGLNDKHMKDVWLWGQINRILPLKIALRNLVMLLTEDNWIELEYYRESATQFALDIGEKIQRYEESINKIRDDKISTGLPDKENYKSSDRYKFHFLAFLRNDELIDGALGVMRFVNLKKEEKKVQIGITKQGLRFAQLNNPVLDNNNYDNSLSKEEIDFLLRHIQKYVKNEWNAIYWLLNKIGTKGTKREILNKEIEKEFKEKWNCSLAVINTQRAGLMARMSELGLIEKVKKGIYVTYYINKLGYEISKKIKYYENE